MKKILTILILIAISFSIMSCKTENNKGGTNESVQKNEPNIKDIILQTNSTDLNTISKQIMEKFFDEYKKETVNKNIRIADYKIVSITNIQGNTNKFQFDIDYSLKPSDINSYCLAGNGSADGSWIVHKYAFVEIENSTNGYKIINIGTGR